MNWPLLREYGPALLQGLLTTLGLAALVLVVAMPLAFLIALCRQQRLPLLAPLLRCYVEVFRAVPALVVLYFTFYGLPRLGMALQPFQAAALGMSLTSIAYVSEDFRASLASIPIAQWEAAHALGLSRRRILRRVVLPQALPVLLPPVMANVLVTIKATALASLVGVPELTATSISAMSITFSATDFLVTAAVLYLLISGVIAGAQAAAEWWVRRRFGPTATVARRRRVLAYAQPEP